MKSSQDINIHLQKWTTYFTKLNFQVIHYYKVTSDLFLLNIRWNKMQFLPRSSCVNSAIWMHHMNMTKHIEKMLDRNCTRMLQAILNKPWNQHLIKPQLYGHLPPISKTIQIRLTRHCWRSKNDLISVLLWVPSHGCTSVGWPTRTLQQS